MFEKVMDIINFFFGSVFNIALTVVIIFIAYTVTMFAFNYGQGIGDNLGAAMADEYYLDDPENIIIEIPEDASGLAIARMLREEGLINNEFIFYFQARLNGSHSHFIRGASFALNQTMGEGSIMNILQSPRYRIDTASDYPTITIIEGLNNAQVADVSANLEFFTADEFLYELEHGEFNIHFLVDVPNRPNRLQGFLFPDTYMLPQNPTPRDIVVRQLTQFNEVFTAAHWARLSELNDELGLNISLSDLITIASIVELEARQAAQRPMIAALIYNRMRAGMPLELVSTLSYALNRRADMLTAEDFAYDSPYNTFIRAGLPRGPISNPGLSAIEAALSPVDVPYLYMFMADYDSGRLYFAASLEEYEAARARYSDDEHEEYDDDATYN